MTGVARQPHASAEPGTGGTRSGLRSAVSRRSSFVQAGVARIPVARHAGARRLGLGPELGIQQDHGLPGGRGEDPGQLVGVGALDRGGGELVAHGHHAPVRRVLAGHPPGRRAHDAHRRPASSATRLVIRSSGSAGG